MRRTRQTARVALVLGLMIATLGMGGTPTTTDRQPTPGQTPSARVPEVRMRKLHLVRPDLIPYPIAYEVYC